MVIKMTASTIRKAFKCSCGKSYKTTYGLKNHAAMQHNSSITGLNIKTTIQSTKQQLMKNVNENENIISTLDIVAPLKVSKNKIPAIEDHGYIKSERSILTETEIECDNDLGILTPASTPPLTLHNISKGDQHHLHHQQSNVHQVRTLNKYLTATPNNVNNSSRRGIINNNKNDY
ncbi:hypothetical protein PV325_006728 [Microctonus aethiopoides]|nr:hypothetical protein PV325_006728 [Microctonus aethiopoides]KAK0095940.1 hypothetical protein PV326_007036 [Microctonus aethiopoides]